MDPRTRVFKTLGLLVVSMTTSTVLLSRLEPAASGTVPSAWHHGLWRVVQSAVASAGPVAPSSWSGVEILLEREVTGLAPDALIALEGTGICHFWIGGTGEVSALRAWSTQRPDMAGGVVRVALAGRNTGSSIPPLQWTALRMLLAELEGVLVPAVPPGSSEWRITLSDEAAGDNALRAHLRSEGLLG